MDVNKKKKSNPMKRFVNSVKRAVAGVLSFVINKWNALQKETRKVWKVFVVTGSLLLAVVLLLAVRLGSVQKELKSVQTLSTSLQKELDQVKAGIKDDKTEVVTREPDKQSFTVAPVFTKTPIPTVTPTPKKYVVCIDAGHGDWDGGAVWNVNGVEVRIEKDDNLRMAKLFRDALEAYGIEVVMTRETDVFLELGERARIANTANADAFISLHRNSYAGTEDVNGIEFWIHNSKPKDAQELAQRMLNEIMAVGGLTNRGVKFGTIESPKYNYVINSRANMASMIIEMGFVSSASDNAAYDTHGKAYAQGMARAVFEWLKEQEN